MIIEPRSESCFRFVKDARSGQVGIGHFLARNVQNAELFQFGQDSQAAVVFAWVGEIQILQRREGGQVGESRRGEMGAPDPELSEFREAGEVLECRVGEAGIVRRDAKVFQVLQRAQVGRASVTEIRRA